MRWYTTYLISTLPYPLTTFCIWNFFYWLSFFEPFILLFFLSWDALLNYTKVCVLLFYSCCIFKSAMIPTICVGEMEDGWNEMRRVFFPLISLIRLLLSSAVLQSQSDLSYFLFIYWIWFSSFPVFSQMGTFIKHKQGDWSALQDLTHENTRNAEMVFWMIPNIFLHKFYFTFFLWMRYNFAWCLLYLIDKSRVYFQER